MVGQENGSPGCQTVPHVSLDSLQSQVSARLFG